MDALDKNIFPKYTTRHTIITSLYKNINAKGPFSILAGINSEHISYL